MAPSPQVLGNPLLDSWENGETIFGIFCSSTNPIAAEFGAALGLHYVCIDLQHGMADLSNVFPMIKAVQHHRAAPIVRVAANDSWQIQRALDLGASGVIVPLVNNAEDAKRAVEACRYPPTGHRSYGPTIAALGSGVSDLEQLQRVACLLMIETAEGLANLESIVSVPGVDGIYVGPSDLSLALGLPPTPAALSNADHSRAIESIRLACVKYGLITGINCDNGDSARARAEQGFRMITIGNDNRLLRDGIRAELAKARGEG